MQIIDSQDTPKGKYVVVEAENKLIHIILTWHSMDSIKDYRIKLEDILHYLLYPEEVIIGHGNRFIAHRKLNNHLARVVYEYEMNKVVVVTFYISYVNRYFVGGIYEDKILSRC